MTETFTPPPPSPEAFGEPSSTSEEEKAKSGAPVALDAQHKVAEDRRRCLGTGAFLIGVLWPVCAASCVLHHMVSNVEAVVNWPRGLIVAAAFVFSGVLLRVADRMTMPITRLIELEEAAQAGKKKGADAGFAEEVAKAAQEIAKAVQEALKGRSGG